MTDRPVDLSFLKDEAVKYIDLSSLRIANCVGCFGCWTKTPGAYSGGYPFSISGDIRSVPS